MLIKRLLHRWVLMNEAGGADGGAAGAGGASAAGAAAAGAGAGSAVVSGDAAGAAAAAGTGSDGAGAAAASGVAAAGEAAKTGIDVAALQPPASLVGEAGKEGEAAEGEAKEGAEAAGKEGEKVDDAPIEYTDFTLPEGVEVSAETMTAFKEAAAGAKLTQEQAQKFVDLHQDAINKAAAAPYEMWRDTQEAWQKEIKADPEFGGAKLETETIPSIARAIKAFSPNADAEKALRQAFHFTGAGNHPEMIRFMARIGKSLAEGTHVGGAPTSGDGGKSAAQKLYPTQGGNAQS